MLNPNPPEAVRSPVMFQSWNQISFLHWRHDAEPLQECLPSGLRIQTFDGTAWIGLTPFLLEHLRLPFLPPLPWFSRFPETNVRTYVTGPKGAGIWFFSLDADRVAAVLGARLSFGLPYYWADMRVRREGTRMDYYLSRGGRAKYRIQVEIGGAIETPDDLLTFLTARFRLYTIHRNRLASGAVEHKPWPLRTAQLIQLDETLTAAAGLKTGGAQPLVHFSYGVHTRIGRLELVG